MILNKTKVLSKQNIKKIKNVKQKSKKLSKYIVLGGGTKKNKQPKFFRPDQVQTVRKKLHTNSRLFITPIKANITNILNSKIHTHHTKVNKIEKLIKEQISLLKQETPDISYKPLSYFYRHNTNPNFHKDVAKALISVHERKEKLQTFFPENNPHDFDISL